MPTLKGIAKLKKAIEHAQELAEQVREALDEKQEWLNDKSEKYQESDAGQEWEDFLYKVEEILDDLDNIDLTEIE